MLSAHFPLKNEIILYCIFSMLIIFLKKGGDILIKKKEINISWSLTTTGKKSAIIISILMVILLTWSVKDSEHL